jgi:hypothetical protein
MEQGQGAGLGLAGVGRLLFYFRLWVTLGEACFLGGSRERMSSLESDSRVPREKMSPNGWRRLWNLPAGKGGFRIQPILWGN